MSERAPSARVRAFIAVEASPAQREAVAAIIERLSRTVRAARSTGAPADSGRDARSPGPVRWVAAHQAHVTVAFLGNVAHERLGEIEAAVAAVAAAHPAFETAFGGVGAFPDARRPRVIWLGVERGSEEMTGAALAVRRALVPLGFEEGEAPFRPHLTLGRIRRGASVADRAAVAAALAGSPAEAGTPVARVDHVTLMASRMGSEGAVHSVIGRADLGAAQAS